MADRRPWSERLANAALPYVGLHGVLKYGNMYLRGQRNFQRILPSNVPGGTKGSAFTAASALALGSNRLNPFKRLKKSVQSSRSRDPRLNFSRTPVLRPRALRHKRKMVRRKSRPSRRRKSRANPRQHNTNYSKSIRRVKHTSKKHDSKLIAKVKRLIAKPDWSRAVRTRDIGVGSLVCAANKVAYSQFEPTLFKASELDDVISMINGDSSLSFQRITESAPPVIEAAKLDMYDAGATLVLGKKLKYRFDLQVVLKNASNAPAYAKIYVFKCIKNTALTALGNANTYYDMKQQTPGATLEDDHWVDISQYTKHKDAGWKLVNVQGANLSAGQSSTLDFHLPWTTMTPDVWLHQGQVQDFQVGMYQVYRSIRGELTHEVGDVAIQGYSPASIVYSFNLKQYASYLNGDRTNKLLFAKETLGVFTNPLASEMTIPGQLAFAG